MGLIELMQNELDILRELSTIEDDEAITQEEREEKINAFLTANANSCEKLEKTAKFMRFLSGLAQNAETEVKILTERKRKIENTIDKIKTVIKYYMEATGQDRIDQGNLTFSLRASEAVVEIDPEAPPEALVEFVQTVITRKIDKIAVKNAVKTGKLSPEFVKVNKNLQIKIGAKNYLE